MKLRPILLCATATLFVSPAAIAQEQPIELPEACRTAAMASGAQEEMQTMRQDMSQNVDAIQEGMAEVTPTQRGLHESMNQMNGPMMEGTMNKDADVAWICSMIPHHMGAIAMAQAGLEGADNEKSRELAEKTIAENKKGLEELIAWVEEHAHTESEDEAEAASAQ